MNAPTPHPVVSADQWLAQRHALLAREKALTRLHDRRWLTLLGSSRAVGSFDGAIGVEGETTPESGFDMPGDPRSHRAGVNLLGDYRASEAVTVGGSLSFQRSRDNLPNPVHGKANPYVPENRPAIGDLMNMFDFSRPAAGGL